MSDARTVPMAEIARLIAPFEEPIESVKVSWLYRFALTAVAIAMILLPLIYLALIGVVGWGLWLHATENASVFKTVGDQSMKFALLAYLGPLVVGGILLIFMVKPIFARRPKMPEPVSLDPNEEPTLFAFVAELCDSVGACRPVRIDVDHQVNASASFRRGVRSMLGNDLVLTIGLPLVGGLTMRQLTGVLAHEFGHFAQGTGMRVTYVIRSVSYWFSRVVYERDEWDLQLEELSKSIDLWLGIMLYVARFFVWLTSRVLWVLMMVGHFISCFMLRSMEYDADRYEARVSGSQEFEATVYRLQQLNVASQMALNTVQQNWRTGRLADDIPALVSFSAARLPDGIDEAIREGVRSGKTKALDTHPADQDRIASARRENAEGVFRLEGPATALFHDFEGLSRRVTVALYDQQLDSNVPDSRLIPSATLIEDEQDHESAVQVATRYFYGKIPAAPPLVFSTSIVVTPPEDARDAYRELRDLRDEVERGVEDAGRRAERYWELDERVINLNQAYHLIEAGFKVDGTTLGLDHGTSSEASELLEDALEERRCVADAGGEFREVLRRRLELALQLAHHGQATENVDDVAAGVESSERMLAALACISENADRIDAMRRSFAAYDRLLDVLQTHQGSSVPMVELRKIATRLMHSLSDLSGQCQARHPFEEGATIGSYCVGSVPQPTEYGELHSCARLALDRFHATWHQSIASLVGFAVRIEAAFGMPLPEVTPPPDSAAGD